MTLRLINNIIDLAAVGVGASTVIAALPDIVLFLSAIWLLIRIFEHIRWLMKGRPPR